MKTENELFYNLCLKLIKKNKFKSMSEYLSVLFYVDTYNFYFIENQLPFQGAREMITIDIANSDLLKDIMELKEKYNITL